MKTLFAKEKGSVLIISAVGMTLFCIIAALVLDIGRMWLYSAQLQSACDAAALGGASVIRCRMEVDGLGTVYSAEYTMDPEAAKAEAQTVMDMNLATLGGLTSMENIIEANPDTMEVSVSTVGQAEGAFLRFAGTDEALNIRRQASARFVPEEDP